MNTKKSTLVLPACIAATAGFIALSFEIIWIRAFSYMSHGTAPSFGYILAAYLGGLAIGARVARFACKDDGEDARNRALRNFGWTTLAASVIGFLAVPLVAWFASATPRYELCALVTFGFASASLGLGFPLLAHSAITDRKAAGAGVSVLLVGNIVGSTLGSLVTGLITLEHLSMRDSTFVISLMGVAVAVWVCFRAATSRRDRVTLGIGAAVALGGLMSTRVCLYELAFERMFYRDDFHADYAFAKTIENRSGIVNITYDGALYGGGAYDGFYNVSPLPEYDINRVARAYAVSAFHTDPKEILVIGCGSGSWVQVLANHPRVERVTVVEINPAYIELMAEEPAVMSALDNPKVEVIIDDGRRFLNRTDRKFDLIVQNTVVFWRSHATNLLSKEYMELTRSRLNTGGYVYLNCTSSTSAQRTCAATFDHALRFQNMVIAGDSPILINLENWFVDLLDWKIDGEHVIDPERDESDLHRLLFQTEWRSEPAWESRARILQRTARAPIITDDNMVTEWWAFQAFP